MQKSLNTENHDKGDINEKIGIEHSIKVVSTQVKAVPKSVRILRKAPEAWEYLLSNTSDNHLIYIYIYIYISCRAVCRDLPDPLSPPVHHHYSWLQVLLCITNNSIKHQSLVYTHPCRRTAVCHVVSPWEKRNKELLLFPRVWISQRLTVKRQIKNVGQLRLAVEGKKKCGSGYLYSVTSLGSPTE